MREAMALVLQFCEKFGVTYRSRPILPSAEELKLRVKLIHEEANEFDDSTARGDLVGMADALADLTYVVLQAALVCGIDLDPVFREVHRSNMTKVWEDGTVHRREDGKILKPPTYSPADVARVLGEQVFGAPRRRTWLEAVLFGMAEEGGSDGSNPND